MATMGEGMLLLIELQNLDLQIFKLKKEKESKPEDIKLLEEAFKEKEKKLKDLDEKLKSVQLARKEKEVELETRENNIKKYRAQLGQVKTNKEYSSIEKEIASIKADNSVLEEDILKLFDETDVVKESVAKEKSVLKIEEENLNRDRKIIESRISDIEKEIETLNNSRKALVGKIDKEVLSKYERIMRNKEDGIAMVQVKQDACQGCFMNLPPQVINEIKMKQNLVFCENCARLLYIEE